MYLEIDRPHIALNSEKYITIRQQELRTCKRIGYECYCKELFMVKHKSKYSCESTLYLDLDPDIIKENCGFIFYYNQTDTTPTVLDGGNEIILANWPNDKYIISNINNDITVKIPSQPYVLVNISVLCNCSIETENNILLESLGACHDSNSKLVMYFMVNKAFVNYLDQFHNLTNTLNVPIKMDKSTFKQTLPISLHNSKFNADLLTAPQMLKNFVHQYHKKKEVFDLKERHVNMNSELLNKNSFFNNFTTGNILFIAAIILLLVTILVMYILCKNIKIKTLVTSLALQQIKEVGAVTRQKDILPNIECTCKIH